jgi:nicotinamide-nucleotide adenylyltransferase
VREVATTVDEVLLCIAAAADAHTPDNPFTSGERRRMITLAMEGAGLEAYSIMEVPDIHNYPVWARYVSSLCPPFDVVVAHNPTTLDLFRNEGVEAREATPYQMETYSGTRIRRLMAEGGDWEELVPPAVATYLKAIDGPGRVARYTGDRGG